MIEESELLEYAAKMRDVNTKGKMCAVPILHEVGKRAIEGVYLGLELVATKEANNNLVKMVENLKSELREKSVEEHSKAAFFLNGCFIGAAIGLGIALIIGF